MKILAIVVLCGLFFTCAAGQGFAAGVGTTDEAKTMVEKAATYLKANGKEKSFAEFSNPKGRFKDRDLYIYVVDMKGTTLAHGGNPALVGVNMTMVKDADGKLFMKEVIEGAQKKGKGWSDYKWTNPTSKVVEAKTAYYQKVDDVIVGCGAYKQ